MSKANEFLAQQIKFYRKKLGFSQEHFAEHVGLSLALISEMERGKSNPTIMTLEKIATKLQLPLSDLLDAYDSSETEEYLREVACNNIKEMNIKQLRITLAMMHRTMK